MNDKEQFYRQIVLQKCVSPDLKELTHFLFFWKKEIIRLLWKLEISFWEQSVLIS